MARSGTYRVTTSHAEDVRAFIPAPLPLRPRLVLDDAASRLHEEALAALARLALAGHLVPSARWFLHGFVRKEALVSSQIEGTQATLQDVLTYEATHESGDSAGAEEVCNYVDALAWARKQIADPNGLPLCSRLLSGAHARLMRGVRGAEKQPGTIRSTQNWIGGSRPGNAALVPPPPDVVPEALSALDRWLHAKDPLPPLVRAGLAHVQFEMIHPFLDGNGRIGRLLVTLLVEHWRLLEAPLLYLSLAIKRRRSEYYACLDAVRSSGDWIGWTRFFLRCVREAADDGVAAATRLVALLDRDRRAVTARAGATLPALRLLEALPEHPMVTLRIAVRLLDVTKPTASKAIEVLRAARILHESTGRRRDRVYAYAAYLSVLAEDTQPESDRSDRSARGARRAARPRTTGDRTT